MKTPNRTNDASRIDAYCQHCKSCHFDAQRGLICGLTNDYGNFPNGECKHFDPHESCVKKNNEPPKPDNDETGCADVMALFILLPLLAALYLACVVNLVRGHVTMATILVALTAGALLVGSVVAYLRYRKIRLKEITAGRLDRNKIIKILRDEGYRLLKKSDECIWFNASGIGYMLYYSPQSYLSISLSCDLQYKDVDRLRAIANTVMRNIIAVKFMVYDFKQCQSTGLLAQIQTFAKYEAEFRENFSSYIACLEGAMRYFFEILECEEQRVAAMFDVCGLHEHEYHLFPKIVDAVVRKQLPVGLLSDEESLRQLLQRDVPADFAAMWNEFKILRAEQYGYYRLLVYKFPEPQSPPDALYGAVLFDMQNEQADYYTLELFDNNTWFLGSTTPDGLHTTICEAESSNLEQFIAWILSSNQQTHNAVDTNDGDTTVVN